MSKFKFLLNVSIFSSVIILLAFWLMAYTHLKKAAARPDGHKYNKQRELKKNLLKNHNFEEVSFKTEDGLTISGLLILRQHAKRVILITHGYKQAKEFLVPFADLFQEDNILLIDFRAHGSSQGEKISWGNHEAKDVKAALKYLETNEKTKDLPVYGIGLSMGAVALAKAASEGSGFRALVLDSGFASFKKQSRRFFENKTSLPKCVQDMLFYLFNNLMKDEIDNLKLHKFISKVKVPMLMIHSKTDRIVPIKDALKICKNISSKYELWVVGDSEHVRIHLKYPQIYAQKVLNFFKSVE